MSFTDVVRFGEPDNIEFKEIGPGDPVLDLIYGTLLVPFFSDNDRDSCRDLHAYLSQNEVNRRKRIKFHIVAALVDTVPIGTTIFAFFGADDFCLMSGHYTAVLPGERGKHLATRLDRSRQEIATITARCFGYDALDLSTVTMPLFNKVTDVNRSMSSKAVINAEKIWKHLGYHRLDFPFIQLPLAEKKKPTSHSLWIKRHTQCFLERDFLSRDEMQFIIEASNYFRRSRTALTSYPEYTLMVEFMQNHRQLRFYQ